MIRLRVVHAAGAHIVGPAKVKLTDDQHARRVPVFGPKKAKGGVYFLPEGIRATFKCGEEFEVEAAATGRLNPAMFLDLDAAEKEAAAKAAAQEETGGGA